ncbi:hypothetical protein ACFGWM_03455 [Pasteurella multocida]
MLFSKFKQRYIKLLQETQNANQNWNGQGYNEEVGNKIWEATKQASIESIPHLAPNIVSLMSSHQNTDEGSGWKYGYEGTGYDDSEDYDE